MRLRGSWIPCEAVGLGPLCFTMLCLATLCAQRTAAPTPAALYTQRARAAASLPSCSSHLIPSSTISQLSQSLLQHSVSSSPLQHHNFLHTIYPQASQMSSAVPELNFVSTAYTLCVTQVLAGLANFIPISLRFNPRQVLSN